MSTATKSGAYSVIATGPVTAGGSINLAAGTGQLKLAGGNLKITPKFGPTKVSVNKAACLQARSGRGTYALGDGTGKFAGVSGSGKFTLSMVQINARKANCTCSAAKVAVFEGVITASGPASAK
jgi:hypothetical protein